MITSSIRPPRQRPRGALLFTLGTLAVLTIGGLENRLDAKPAGEGPGGDSAPGVLVDVGGFRLHLRCAGAGRPTVIVESGLGDMAESWVGVQSVVAGQTRICVYDRPGMGWSDRDPRPPTLRRSVRNLRTLLDHAGIEGPYVLAGHAAGGLLVRRFAADYPNEVAAVLLVDSAHENQARRLARTLPQVATADRAGFRFCGIEAPLTIVRAAGLVNAYFAIAGPENLRPMHPATVGRTRYCASVRAEARAFQAGVSDHEPPQPLGDLPLLVLTAGRGMALDPQLSRTGVPVEAAAEWDSVWLQLQRELVALSTTSTQRTVEDAGHFIQLDRPDAVVDAIGELVETVQGRESASPSR